MKLLKFRVGLLVALVFCASALAHKPLLSVDDNEDGTVYIEVGFSDGSSGSGHDIILKDTVGKVLNEFKVPEESSLDIDMPATPYTVTFFAGEGHEVTVEGPFAENDLAAEEVSAVVESSTLNPPVTLQAAPVQVAAQPVAVQSEVVAQVRTNEQSTLGRGFNMALKMLITTNICIAVFIGFLLAVCAFWLGYSVAKSKNNC